MTELRPERRGGRPASRKDLQAALAMFRPGAIAALRAAAPPKVLVDRDTLDSLTAERDELRRVLRTVVDAATFAVAEGPDHTTEEVEQFYIDRDTAWMNAVREARAALSEGGSK